MEIRPAVSSDIWYGIYCSIISSGIKLEAEWMPISRGSGWIEHATPWNILLLSHVSRVRLCGTPWTAAHQAPVPGILQARILAWAAISFSNAWKWKVKVKSLSRVWLLTTPWTAAYQAPPSMGFPRQEYWSGLPLPSLWNILFLHKIS